MQHEEKIMLERGINTPERERELWYFQTYGLAIIKTLEEFKKNMYEKKQKEFYSFIICHLPFSFLPKTKHRTYVFA